MPQLRPPTRSKSTKQRQQDKKRATRQRQRAEYKAVQSELKKFGAAPKARTKTFTPNKLYKARGIFEKIKEFFNPKEYFFIPVSHEKKPALKQAAKIGVKTTKKGMFVKKYGESDIALTKVRGKRGQPATYKITKTNKTRGQTTEIYLDENNTPDRMLARLEAEAAALQATFSKKSDRLSFKINDATGNVSRNTFSSVADLRKYLERYNQRSPELWRGFLNSIEIVKTSVSGNVDMRRAVRAARKRRFRDVRERKTGK